MKAITNTLANLVTSVTSIPENLRHAITEKIGEALAEKIKDEIVKGLEEEGFDVNLNLTVHIKKH